MPAQSAVFAINAHLRPELCTAMMSAPCGKVNAIFATLTKHAAQVPIGAGAAKNEQSMTGIK